MSQKTDRKIYTVSELTRNIKLLLEEEFPQVWVEGEISNLKIYPSGHAYLDLKDENAILKCVIWKWTLQYIRFKLEDGQKIVCLGKISLYEERGQHQLYIEKIEPKGIGALALAFEQLKTKLSKEGLFDESHKKPIPLLPRVIGIVTSPTSAVIKDILNILRRRFVNIEIIINPVRVQGKGAEIEIANAIEEFNRFGGVDVMVLARGGGSIEDLWAFNEEIVARAIFNSKIPVISAIGHETDYTIADFVCDLRAPTPSAAAELVVEKKGELINVIENYKNRIASSILHRIKDLRVTLVALRSDCESFNPINILQKYQQRIDDLTGNIITNISHLMEMK
ncbi:MAG: exodeoxyribonuclease VII large subunit, partial [Candidatus Omnitrophica bacterium]|nr:exodeoxyribonuclease VII large subunit [Candidatus Omnitrophota bacterium]